MLRIFLLRRGRSLFKMDTPTNGVKVNNRKSVLSEKKIQKQVVHIFTVWYPCSISIKEEEEYFTRGWGGVGRDFLLDHFWSSYYTIQLEEFPFRVNPWLAAQWSMPLFFLKKKKVTSSHAFDCVSPVWLLVVREPFSNCHSPSLCTTYVRWLKKKNDEENFV